MKASIAAAAAAFAVTLPVVALAQTPVVDKTLPATHAKALSIDAGGGDVTLVPDQSAGSVRVRIEQSGASGTPPPVRSTTNGSKLAITIGSSGGGSMIPFAAAAATAFTIDYPPSMNVDIRVSSGNVHVVRPSAQVQIYSGQGDVTVDAPAARVAAEAAHGTVTTTNAMGPVDLASDLGDVNAQLAPGWHGDEVRIQCEQGAIHLTVPQGFRGKLDVTSGTGNVHNELGKSNAKKPLVFLYAPAGDVSIAVVR
ncbi:MAG: DUF4097 family beta strand repeat protein [Candidatus Eremiobacteraeota bacterium]|nr:DUF4097 family beta strand repeat protein [Candidatus Eremiobacteraeota bacterium]